MTDPDRLRALRDDCESAMSTAWNARVSVPAHVVLAVLDHLSAAEKARDAWQEAFKAAYERAARIAERKFAQVHTYASENTDRYVAMRDAGNEIAAAIRALSPLTALPQTTKHETAQHETTGNED